MEARIGTDGAVRKRQMSFHRSMRNSRMKRLRRSASGEFSPTYLNCEPIEVQMFVTVKFKAEP